MGWKCKVDGGRWGISVGGFFLCVEGGVLGGDEGFGNCFGSGGKLVVVS